jgi:hypothetical protein
MAAKLPRLTHKIAIQPHPVAESCIICSSRSRRPVLKLLDTPSYTSRAEGSRRLRSRVRIALRTSVLKQWQESCWVSFFPFSGRQSYKVTKPNVFLWPHIVDVQGVWSLIPVGWSAKSVEVQVNQWKEDVINYRSTTYTIQVTRNKKLHIDIMWQFSQPSTLKKRSMVQKLLVTLRYLRYVIQVRLL